MLVVGERVLCLDESVNKPPLSEESESEDLTKRSSLRGCLSRSLSARGSTGSFNVGGGGGGGAGGCGVRGGESKSKSSLYLYNVFFTFFSMCLPSKK